MLVEPPVDYSDSFSILVNMETGSENTSPTLIQAYVKIVAVVALYWVVSISLVFINKSLLSDTEQHLSDAPLSLTWFQCAVSVLIYAVVSGVNKPTKGLNSHTMGKVLPLSVVFVAMMTFNNLCLKHLGVSFYYVGRSLVHVFNVILTWFILGEGTSRKALLCCFAIFVGFVLGVQQEGALGSLTATGTVYGILSSLFLSLNSIYTKKLLPAVQQSVWLLGFYNNINACLLFIPLMILNGEVAVLAAFPSYSDAHFWFLMISGGVFGTAISYVMGLQIQLTSPLTNTISGTAKACCQTVLATHWYGEVKPLLWWLSNWVVLFGGAAYARVRQLEMERKHTPAAAGKSWASTSASAARATV